jgi:hypothetical protein
MDGRTKVAKMRTFNCLILYFSLLSFSRVRIDKIKQSTRRSVIDLGDICHPCDDDDSCWPAAVNSSIEAAS